MYACKQILVGMQHGRRLQLQYYILCMALAICRSIQNCFCLLVLPHTNVLRRFYACLVGLHLLALVAFHALHVVLKGGEV